MPYPFLITIDRLLNKQGKTKEWLAKETGISYKTIYNRDDIMEVSNSYILKLNKALQFDFLKDYNEWIDKNGGEKVHMVSEPEGEYQVAKKTITVGLNVRGTPAAIGLHFADILDTLQKEADKYGLKIE